MSKAFLHDFLWGRLSGQETSGFLDQLENNPLLRDEFEKELVYEGLFYSMSWNIQTAPGLEKESDWLALVAPQSIIEKGPVADHTIAFEWNAAINDAFATTFPQPVETKRTFRMIPFPKVFRYLAAACIVGAIVTISFVNHIPDRPFIATGITRDTISREKSDPIGLPPATSRVASITFDSVIIYSSRSLAGKPLLNETRDGIVRIGDKTAILLDKNSSVAVTSQSDSAVSIDLKSGGALFTVEKHRFNQFSITTPACNIAVTGTIFRLAVDNGMTIVSVLEGSVKANKRYDTTTVSILAGMSARIRPDTIMLENGDTAATLLYRSNLLSDFLHENGVFQNGMFVRCGITEKNDTLARREHFFENSKDEDR